MTAAAAYKAVPKATTNEAVPKVTAIHNNSVKEDVPKGGAKMAAPQGPAKDKATPKGNAKEDKPKEMAKVVTVGVQRPCSNVNVVVLPIVTASLKAAFLFAVCMSETVIIVFLLGGLLLPFRVGHGAVGLGRAWCLPCCRPLSAVRFCTWPLNECPTSLLLVCGC